MTFPILFTFTDIYLHVPILIKVGHKQRGLHTKTYAVHITNPQQAAKYLPQQNVTNKAAEKNKTHFVLDHLFLTHYGS
jgi:hypothetical protein